MSLRRSIPRAGLLPSRTQFVAFTTKASRGACAGGGHEARGEAALRVGGGGVHIPRPNFWQNFSKISLVFGCIGTDLCK